MGEAVTLCMSHHAKGDIQLSFLLPLCLILMYAKDNFSTWTITYFFLFFYLLSRETTHHPIIFGIHTELPGKCYVVDNKRKWKIAVRK